MATYSNRATVKVVAREGTMVTLLLVGVIGIATLFLAGAMSFEMFKISIGILALFGGAMSMAVKIDELLDWFEQHTRGNVT
ncbi:MAG TPA: hypothetical protein VJI74_00140 [Candidatus Paceibacterota bacterium]